MDYSVASIFDLRKSMSLKSVLMDHDGGIDDFLAMILLLTMPEIEPLGIVVTPADCYPKAAVRVSQKILNLMGRSGIKVAESTVRGINPFPPEFRKDCITIDRFPILNEQSITDDSLATETGTQFMVRCLENAPEPITLMVTAPLTTVAEAIAIEPAIISKIQEIIWMGGALQAAGNVQKSFAQEHDGTAEWNVFWDAVSAKQIWQTNIPVTLCPLDITNTVPVTDEFLLALARQRSYPLSDLAGLCYSLAIPQDYYCWDVLATAYLGCPELFRTEEIETDIIVSGNSQGRTVVKPGGRKIRVMTAVDRDRFYSYLLARFSR